MGGIIAKVTRKKALDQVTSETSLKRCLTTFDLTVMGIGSMVGSGIYVMTGQASKETAGPAIVVSFVLAAVVILMVAGCFTEFAARLQKTGSTYLYLYITLGELPAFLIGFCTICLSILSGATNARAWSAYLDSLLDGRISNYTMTKIADWEYGQPLARYPDFAAMAVVLVMTVVILLGAKCSSWVNTVFAMINIGILTFVSILGFVYGDIDNWTNPEHGGFFPYGMSGVVSGSAVCFWAFSGFEILSCAVEESVNPKRDIPIATVAALSTVMVLYVGATSALTLITPFYEIDTGAPFPSAFAARSLYWVRMIVSVGPLCGLTTTMMASLYASVRTAYKIAEDGLLFEWMSRVDSCSQVPVTLTVVEGLITAFAALCLDISELINFSVILVLLSYILVCACVIILRYSPSNPRDPGSSMRDAPPSHTDVQDSSDNDTIYSMEPRTQQSAGSVENGGTDSYTAAQLKHEHDLVLYQTSDPSHGPNNSTTIGGSLKDGCSRLWPCNRMAPGCWPKVAILLMLVGMVLVALTCIYFSDALATFSWWAVTILVLCPLTVIVLLSSIYAHHQNIENLVVKMPLVPMLPVMCIFLCLYMLLSLARISHWIEFAVLTSISLIIYFGYSISHSKLNTPAHYSILTTAHASDTTALLAGQDSQEEDAL